MEKHVQLLCSTSKGVLASDESTGTIGKRFAKVGLPNNEETRRSYRELFYTANVGDYFSGAIMYKEALYQADSHGIPFIECLKQRGILPGIKVDEGLQEIESTDGETETKGLGGLSSNLEKYKAQGAVFAKWRAALKLGDGCPSDKAIQVNAEQLAEYAAICQRQEIVPIVEPELLIDGSREISTVMEASARVLSACVSELWKRSVVLEHCLLKPQMINGIPSTDAEKSEQVARETIRVMRRFIPAAVPGILFLSGGQSEAEASINLAMINKHAEQMGNIPWRLSFSFGRALQASVLHIWSRDRATNREEAQRKAEAIAKVNSLASQGILPDHHPSILSNSALIENFRGWNQS